MQLKDLRLGQQAQIVACESVPLKLVEMGCVKGAEVKLLHRFPWKGPLYIQLNQVRIAIDWHTAQNIEVQLHAHSPHR